MRYRMVGLLLVSLLTCLGACRHSPIKADEKPNVAAPDQTTPAVEANEQQQAQEQQPTTAVELPPAESILERFLEVTGSKAKLKEVRTRVSSGTFGMPAMNIKGAFNLYQALPNKSHMIVDLPGIGKQEIGCDGQTVWEISSVTGSRILTGQERIDTLQDNMLHAAILWRTLLRKVETIGVASVGGKPTYKVLLTPVEGSQRTAYYDQETGLLVRFDMVSKTQMGEVPAESYLSTYTLVDGMQMPFKTVVKALSMEQEIILTKVEHNVEIPPKHFVLPAEIQALIEQNKAAPKAASQASGS